MYVYVCHAYHATIYNDVEMGKYARYSREMID